MSRTKSICPFILAGAAALVAGLAVTPASSESRQRPQLAPVPEARPPRPPNTTKCSYQDPQPFLMRENHRPMWKLPPEERRARVKLHEKAIEFRTKNYGYFEGFGQKAWNRHPPSYYAKMTSFMGLKVRLNERIHPVFQCVEEQINQECKATPYQPKRLSSLRMKNTYHTGEVSNHVYGIAIDIDPQENTCCGCVPPWNEHAKCQRPAKSVYDRMIMPECWVHVFERFGFHWLGRDKLQDTMHFEFLGDPDKILKSPPG